ncbi:MAG: hypothetical protein M1818_004966 [Claussenomyces sp. TS43310]|nr:MAG: hypothetical protein M1818_004966 [Claussenomyces sp. TS43310]
MMKLSLFLSACLGLVAQTLAQDYWYETITHQGYAPYNADPSTYNVYRNVKDFGAKGDGVTDDTAAINSALSQGSRCVPSENGCQSTTTSPAVVYFPAGTYLISSSIIDYYLTQLIGNPNDMPTLKATAGFTGLGLIDGDNYGGQYEDYKSVNVFYRQIRNFVFDMTDVDPGTSCTGVHWPTAQATSLQNCVFQMSSASGTQHRGMFIEDGSGGFLGDLVFNGGLSGVQFGNQQFTTRNLTFNNAVTAIDQIWDWGWTYVGITINNCGTGLNLSATGGGSLEVGSVTFIDSSISNTPVGFSTARSSTSTPTAAGSLALENVVLNNVPTAIQGASGTLLEGSTGSMTIAAWVDGDSYTSAGTKSVVQGTSTPFTRPSSLLDGSNYYTRIKPQYNDLAASQFSSVRTAGAKGDGVTDDTAAIQSIINSATAAGNVVYFDYGMYLVTSTITIPAGAKIVGETYPIILGSGTTFQDSTNPQPVVQVGGSSTGTGQVEWSDMVVSTQGATEGAVLIEWNLASSSSSPSGMWDVHTRIGGFAGSDLQLADCPTTATQPNSKCVAAFMSMHITAGASGVYLENCWFWSADHDIEDATNTQITIYSGRGLLIESTSGAIWLYGTAVEHHALYQYQFVNTKDIFMGQIQTETPYYQPAPSAPTPFSPVSSLNDPDFATYCAGTTGNCADAWGLRVLNSQAILVYGAGLYSFFDNYNLTCSNHVDGAYNEYCQNQIFGIDDGGSGSQVYNGSSVSLYNLNTIGAVSMIDVGGKSVAKQVDNTNTFAESVAMFLTS